MKHNPYQPPSHVDPEFYEPMTPTPGPVGDRQSEVRNTAPADQQPDHADDDRISQSDIPTLIPGNAESAAQIAATLTALRQKASVNTERALTLHRHTQDIFEGGGKPDNDDSTANDGSTLHTSEMKIRTSGRENDGSTLMTSEMTGQRPGYDGDDTTLMRREMHPGAFSAPPEPSISFPPEPLTTNRPPSPRDIRDIRQMEARGRK
jgi:hypothetical protein